MVSISNDVASIIQTKGKITIIPHVFHDGKWQPCEETYKFTGNELISILTLYSLLVREKKGLLKKEDET